MPLWAQEGAAEAALELEDLCGVLRALEAVCGRGRIDFRCNGGGGVGNS